MTDEQELYLKIGQQLKDSTESQMFGKPCFKINGKAYMAFFENAMVFKLTGEIHGEAIDLDGAKLFDPSGKKRPMKEWVQVPYTSEQEWIKYAEAARQYVLSKYK